MCKKLMFTVSFVLLLVMVGIVSAVELKVDFGNSGTLGDNDPPDAVGAWTQWAATSGSKTIEGITFTLSNGGLNNGPKIRDWQAGSNDQLTRDAMSEEDPGSGGWYQIEISGLAEGAGYKMRSYHNNCWEAGAFPTTSVSMKLNGGEVDTANLSEQQAYTSAGVCEHAFTASSGSDTFKWDFGQTAFFNGFILQTTNPSVQFASAASGGFESVSPAMIEVTLNNAEPGETYSADYAISDGTATAGDDYAAAATGTVVFNPGETSRNISIDILNDGIDEDDETIMLALSNPVGVDLALGDMTEHTYTIIDPRPSVGFAEDASSFREDDGSVDIPVVLSFAGPDTVTVDYAVTGGTATGGGVDYTLANGTLTFNPGETSQNISVTLIDDEIEEADETIVLTLSNQTNAKKLAISQHTFTIFDKRFVDLQIDLCLPFWWEADHHWDWEGVPIPGTLKDGWIPWCAGRWGDMYGHGAVAMEDVAGTGISMMISTVYGGLSAMKVCGMCMPSLNSDTAPYGSPIHDPICNSWFQVVDKPENPGGDIIMALYNLPPGEYELKSYHNNFECRRLDEGPDGTPNCCDLITNPQPLMPSITALSLDGLIDRYSAYEWWPRWMDPRSEFIICMPQASWDHPVCDFIGEGVEMIEGAYNVPISQVTQDSELVPSLVQFRTNGSAVHIVYESGCCVPDGIRPERSGGKAILNAFELKSLGPPPICPCPGDLDTNDQVDLQDLDAMVNMLVAAGPPFIVPVGPGDCGDLAAPMLQVDLQDLDALVNLLVNAGPPFIVPCE